MMRAECQSVLYGIRAIFELGEDTCSLQVDRAVRCFEPLSTDCTPVVALVKYLGVKWFENRRFSSSQKT